jgi:alpha-tubulin suppressor-like RCC1 family protein
MNNKYFCFLFFIILNCNSQCWKALSNGDNHTVGIKLDGTLWSWGAGYDGELGNGINGGSEIPILISSDTDWKLISAGQSHTLALKNNGTLWGWGYNVFGSVGIGTTNIQNTPIQIGSESNWKVISAGTQSSFAIKTDGTLWGWGQNFYGFLGDGTTVNQLYPKRIGLSSNWSKISSSSYFNAAIKSNGTLWTWGGFNNFGELGYGNFSSAFYPTQVGTDNNWIDTSTGGVHGFGLKNDGTIWGWGTNDNGQLGDGTTIQRLSPTKIGNDTDWAKIECGNYCSYFIKTNGTLWGTGNAILGNGNTVQLESVSQIGNEYNWFSISSSLFQTIGLKENNDGFGWGSNYFGQLGNGLGSESRIYPTLIICSNLNSDNFYSNKKILIYPNPISIEESFIINGLQSESNYNIKIVSLDGKIIQEINSISSNGCLKLKTEVLKTGVYFVSIHNFNENLTFNKKIIKL